MKRLEDAARSEADFNEVIRWWDRLDENRQRRERDHEIGRTSPVMYHWDSIDESSEHGSLKVTLDTVIPEPLECIWWRQMLRGDFLDVIFDCPYEMHELIASVSISKLIQSLNENQKEILYFVVIRQYSPQKIARLRGQSDRNIRKVYSTLIQNIRRKLYEQLIPRYTRKESLTLAQKTFVQEYQYRTKKKAHILDRYKDKH